MKHRHLLFSQAPAFRVASIFENRELEIKENCNSYTRSGGERSPPGEKWFLKAGIRAVPRAEPRGLHGRGSERSAGRGAGAKGATERIPLSVYGRTKDALASAGDEGRGRLRQAPGSRQQALIRRFPNGATRRESFPAIRG